MKLLSGISCRRNFPGKAFAGLASLLLLLLVAGLSCGCQSKRISITDLPGMKYWYGGSNFGPRVTHVSLKSDFPAHTSRKYVIKSNVIHAVTERAAPLPGEMKSPPAHPLSYIRLVAIESDPSGKTKNQLEFNYTALEFSFTGGSTIEVLFDENADPIAIVDCNNFITPNSDNGTDVK